jgi:hypothetical protein
MSANGQRATSEIQDPQFLYATDPEQHFAQQINVNAIENEDVIAFPVPSVLITNISIVSEVNVPYAVYLWGNSAYNSGGAPTANVDFMARINYSVTMATQIGGGGFWFYSLFGIPALTQIASKVFPIPYYTREAPGHLYIGLQVNGGAANKPSFIAGGAVSLKILWQPAGE